MAPSAPVLIEREDSIGRGKWDLTADLTMSLGQRKIPHSPWHMIDSRGRDTFCLGPQAWKKKSQTEERQRGLQ
jgi:hypothetical protein